MTATATATATRTAKKLFCLFLCGRCTTTKWNCLISRFVEDGNKRQQFSFSFPELWYNPLEFNSKSAIKFEAVQIRCCVKVVTPPPLPSSPPPLGRTFFTRAAWWYMVTRDFVLTFFWARYSGYKKQDKQRFVWRGFSARCKRKVVGIRVSSILDILDEIPTI